jgi:hypothetical protein
MILLAFLSFYIFRQMFIKFRFIKTLMVKRRVVVKSDDFGHKCKWHHHHNGCAGYFLGMIGAATWYISQASGFWGGVVGFLKALVWPAFLVYEVLKYLAA